MGDFQTCLDSSGDFSLHIAQAGSCLSQELSVLYKANYGYAIEANSNDLGSFPSFLNISQMCIYIILPHPEGFKSSLHTLFPECSLLESGTGRKEVMSVRTLTVHSEGQQSCSWADRKGLSPCRKLCSIWMKRPVNTDHGMREHCIVAGLCSYYQVHIVSICLYE